jgi:hypothetical protein
VCTAEAVEKLQKFDCKINNYLILLYVKFVKMPKSGFFDSLAMYLELQQRAHSPQLAAGSASESKKRPNFLQSREALPHGRTFPAACCSESSIINSTSKTVISSYQTMF